MQKDLIWDTYFDFLLASPLEIKLNATEELLDLLKSKGRNLSDTYLVEHSFHFDEEQKMFPFMDELSLGIILSRHYNILHKRFSLMKMTNLISW